MVEPRSSPELTGEEPEDVLVDVSNLKVEELNIEVEQLRARVSLNAEVLNLLRLNIGIDADLGRVQLDLRGVEATALLKVRLKNLTRIITRVLDTIDSNPGLVQSLVRDVGTTAREVGGGAAQALPETMRGASQTVREAGAAVGKTSRRLGDAAARATEGVAAGEDTVRRAAPAIDARSAVGAEGRPTRRRRATTQRDEQRQGWLDEQRDENDGDRDQPDDGHRADLGERDDWDEPDERESDDPDGWDERESGDGELDDFDGPRRRVAPGRTPPRRSRDAR
ncbi:hypothetical protein [Dactylosporangium sp. NPDC000521]|uniref:hypothetical protein n=1 Tax=Dactylosporangium sp. NPDC000521 TaxID=3363975 RepID=UPI0036BB9348